MSVAVPAVLVMDTVPLVVNPAMLLALTVPLSVTLLPPKFKVPPPVLLRFTLNCQGCARTRGPESH